MCDVDNLENNSLKIKLSGPLSIFENTQSYGMRMANFFPHIINLKKWTLSALVNVKEKNLTMTLSDDNKLVSHYQIKHSYIPEELTLFISKFNKLNNKLKAETGSEFVHLGLQSYCFPDVSFSDKKGNKFHLELFHRWHERAIIAASRNPK